MEIASLKLLVLEDILMKKIMALTFKDEFEATRFTDDLVTITDDFT